MHPHLMALQRKKERLAQAIEQKEAHAWRDDVGIRVLKREKVYLNDELERLRKAV